MHPTVEKPSWTLFHEIEYELKMIAKIFKWSQHRPGPFAPVLSEIVEVFIQHANMEQTRDVIWTLKKAIIFFKFLLQPPSSLEDVGKAPLPNLKGLVIGKIIYSATIKSTRAISKGYNTQFQLEWGQ